MAENETKPGATASIATLKAPVRRHKRQLDRHTVIAKSLGAFLLLMPVLFFVASAAYAFGFWVAVGILFFAATVFAVMWVGAALLLD